MAEKAFNRPYCKRFTNVVCGSLCNERLALKTALATALLALNSNFGAPGNRERKRLVNATNFASLANQ